MYSTFLFTLGIPNFGQISWKNPGFGAEKTLENSGFFFFFFFFILLLATLQYTYSDVFLVFLFFFFVSTSA